MKARVDSRAAGSKPTGSPAPILGDADIESRLLSLSELQAGLDQLGVQAVLARNHRLALGSRTGNLSGMTDPVLHVFARSGTRKVTTDGTCFQIDSGDEYPADDLSAAAAKIAGAHLASPT